MKWGARVLRVRSVSREEVFVLVCASPLKWTQEWASFEGAAGLHLLEAECFVEFGMKFVAGSE